jgi:hypothetical protein
MTEEPELPKIRQWLAMINVAEAWKRSLRLQRWIAISLLLQSAPNEFLIIGAGLTLKMTRDPDTDAQIAGISSIEEVLRVGSEWKVVARLNGDQSNQGRRLTMDPHKVKIYRFRMYAAPR